MRDKNIRLESFRDHGDPEPFVTTAVVALLLITGGGMLVLAVLGFWLAVIR